MMTRLGEVLFLTGFTFLAFICLVAVGRVIRDLWRRF